jgi:acylphosphatase
MEAAHLLVSGIVQGVGYRAWTEHTAKELGLTGWVRNLDDGRVEIWVEGDRPVLDDFIERCKHGPRFAEVEDVIAEKEAAGGATEFVVRRTTASRES